MRIGFIGLGMMGTPMVLNLRKAGFVVTVWNRTQAKADAARNAGATLSGFSAPTVIWAIPSGGRKAAFGGM
jgi:3-hydroxyisobutyrate dehydrogenase-like beta-hydroxyacid dehydrogenase